MAWRFVRQPNGLLAVFSEVVDTFTILGMTEADAEEYAREKMGRDDAREKVGRGLDDAIDGVRDGDGLTRWRDALHTILLIHGTAALAKFLADHPEAYALTAATTGGT